VVHLWELVGNFSGGTGNRNSDVNSELSAWGCAPLGKSGRWAAPTRLAVLSPPPEPQTRVTRHDMVILSTR